MTQLNANAGTGTITLEQIHEGMKVYDQSQKEVGKVKSIYFGSVADAANNPGQMPETNSGTTNPYPHTFLNDFANALDDPEEIPEVMRSRLAYNGYIRIDTTGWFSRDAYAMPDQIGSVAEDKVYLTVTADELVKR
jgi:hypothetical protein